MTHDLAVLGLGAMGSATLLAGARRGLSVVGIEQFGAAHDQGSSHGQSRIIRTAYYEHPDYVPLARQAVGMWREIESASGSRLFIPAGLLQVGRPNSDVIAGVLNSSRLHDIPLEHLEPAQIAARWPWWKVEDGYIGLFERDAGLLLVEQCVAAMWRLAREAGARVVVGHRLGGWAVDDDGVVQLELGGESIRCRRLAVTAGAWNAELLRGAVPNLTILRKQQQWFHVDHPGVHADCGAPCWLVDEGASGCHYGFPALDRTGIKIAEHSGGEPVPDPARLDRSVRPAELEKLRQFMERWFRFGKVLFSRGSVCMYTMSPDQHFIVDRLPETPQVVCGAGFSGHGFKFAPVIGDLLVRMALGEDCPEGKFLSLNRFAAKTAGKTAGSMH